MDSEPTPNNEHSINGTDPVATAATEGEPGELRQRCQYSAQQ